MEELKLLEKMLRQRDKGELPDYEGEGFEQEQWVDLNSHNSADGIAQTWLDQFRWMKTEDLTQHIWQPEARSSFAMMSQRCAMQVLLEREGENFVKRVLGERRQEQKQAEQWRREHGSEVEGGEGGDAPSISAASKQGAQKKPQKDAARSVGGVKQAEVGHEQGQAGARDLKAVRNSPVAHGESGAWGHMESFIKDRAVSVERDGHHQIKLNTLDLHNRIFIRGQHDPAWSCIEDFEQHYGQAHDTSFATYDGVLLHENQHVEERTAIYNKHLGAFKGRVAAIDAESAEEALEQYEELFAEFERKVDEEYYQVGEVPARALEWEYYHAAYEKETGERGVSKGAARAAGAALGRKETTDQGRELGMMARASEPHAAPFRDTEEPELAGPGLTPDATERAPGLDGAAGNLPRLALNEASSGRPLLLGHFERQARPREASVGVLHFAGARPVFAVGEQTRVVGAKAGVPLHGGIRTGGNATPALGTAVASSEAATRWLLRWWNAGAEEQAVRPEQERR